MNRRKFLNETSLFLYIMVCAAILACLIKLYDGYLQYGEQKQTYDSGYHTEKIEEEENLSNGENSDANEDLPQYSADIEEKDLMNRIDSQEKIRVCLRTSDYSSTLHDYVELTCTEAFEIKRITEVSSSENTEDSLVADTEEIANDTETNEETGEYKCYASEESFRIEAEHMQVGEALRIQAEESARKKAVFAVSSISRSYGVPEYSGDLYLCRLEQGILVINELLLEDYLPSVVASEMPSSYPQEAQKAQAVCARTYAVNCMSRRSSDQEFEAALLEWSQSENPQERQLYDLDDSVEFQVYNNQKATASSGSAVKTTAGEIMDLEEVLYYSTSSGTKDFSDLNTDKAFRAFLSTIPEERAEYGSPWLRWEVCIPEQLVAEKLKEYLKRGVKALSLEKNTEAKDTEEELFSDIKNIEILERNGQGQVQKLKITGNNTSVTIEGEYWIRKVLSVEDSKIHLRNGKTAEGMSMLPSAYFVIDDVLNIRGGGYGHGTGMSQYGAAAMAENGSSYLEILEYYYGAEN